MAEYGEDVAEHLPPSSADSTEETSFAIIDTAIDPSIASPSHYKKLLQRSRLTSRFLAPQVELAYGEWRLLLWRPRLGAVLFITALAYCASSAPRPCR